MLRTVLLAYDHSGEAEDALNLAIELVRCLQADLHIVTVVSADRGELGGVAEVNRHHAWQRLRDAEAIAARGGLSVQVAVVDGEPAAQIVQYARRVTADIIVMGNGYHGHPDPMAGASVAVRVHEQTPCAVLTPRTRRSFALEGCRDSAFAAQRIVVSQVAAEG